MNSPRPGSPRPEPDWAAGRQQLAELVGRLLARRWLRERRHPVPDGSPIRANTAPHPLRAPPPAG
jgi:hypothetical protein